MLEAKEKCSYPNCERFGLGYDIGNDGKPIVCPRRYEDLGKCKEVAPNA